MDSKWRTDTRKSGVKSRRHVKTLFYALTGRMGAGFGGLRGTRLGAGLRV